MTSALPKLPDHAEATIRAFLRAQAGLPGVAGFVVGLSGGIDSALSARLARDAVGPERVLAVLLPDRANPKALLEETIGYAHALGIASTVVPIEPLEAPFRELFPKLGDAAALGNIKARLRMTVLYALARERHRLVLGTGNKSEILLGYFTKHGDGGVDLLPLGDLYKSQVRELAERLGVPAAVRERPPSAGLWEGQTDEGELGMPYGEIDRVLFGLEQLRDEAEIARRTGVDPARVAELVRRVEENRHKRRLPPIPKVGLRTVGIDWKD